ncbi:tetratricopeptide repeat protein [Sphingorhabdus sp.]|uniref:tetratricopeptide repeat protein n=1 Tax=Sphingorhabdus sp. TaxID=1902408 RepID=UPI003BAE1DA0|nr:tetratricopeptide repeat protein [Sphingomonadales bacterium]
MALTPTTKQAATDEAFLREVDDAVRAGDLQSFWTRFGRWLLLALIAGLAAFGGWIYWQNVKAAAAEKTGDAFVQAVEKLDAGNEKAGVAELTKIAQSDQAGYRAMAQLLLANIDAKNGATAKANAVYAKVAADEKAPQVFRDMALIRVATAEFDSLPPQKTIDRLKPLAKPGTPWFGSAGEMTAISYMKMGKDDLAGPIFAQIAKQEDLPQSLRSRAQQMAGGLGIDTVQLDAKSGKASTGGSAATAADGGNSK